MNVDKVDIYTEIAGEKYKYKTFCGTTSPLPVMSSSNNLWINFVADLSSPTARGYNISYKFITGKKKLFTNQLYVPKHDLAKVPVAI